MKRLSKIYFMLAALFVLFSTSCEKEPDMTLVSKTLYEDRAIKVIDAEQYWLLTIITDSTKRGIHVEYSAYLDEYLDISLDNGLLKLGFKSMPIMSSSTRFHATVYVSDLNRLSLSDKVIADFSEDPINTTDMELILKNESVCRSPHFTGSSCKIKLSNASELLNCSFNGNVCKTDIDHNSRFWGNIAARDTLIITADKVSRFTNYSGATAYAEIRLNNGSEANLLPMPIGKLYVELNTNAMASVAVNGSMTGTLQNTSTLYYQGDDPLIDVACDSTSTIAPL